ncbi:MAG: hypothetical protein ABI622_08400 [Chloroflexota bacterium]
MARAASATAATTVTCVLTVAVPDVLAAVGAAGSPADDALLDAVVAAAVGERAPAATTVPAAPELPERAGDHARTAIATGAATAATAGSAELVGWLAGSAATIAAEATATATAADVAADATVAALGAVAVEGAVLDRQCGLSDVDRAARAEATAGANAAVAALREKAPDVHVPHGEIARPGDRRQAAGHREGPHRRRAAVLDASAVALDHDG